MKRSQPALDDEPRDRDRKPDRGEAPEPIRVAERLLEERPLERVRRIRRPLEQPLPERVRADDAGPGEDAGAERAGDDDGGEDEGEIRERALRLEE